MYMLSVVFKNTKQGASVLIQRELHGKGFALTSFLAVVGTTSYRGSIERKEMADRPVAWAKTPISPPSKKPTAGRRKVQQMLQAQVSQPPQPKPKPKPKKKALQPAAPALNLQYDERSSGYAELKDVRRESMNHYAPLCAATRDNKNGGSGSKQQSTLPSVAEEGKVVANDSTTDDLEIHYSNVVHIKEGGEPVSSYENYKFSEEKEERWKCCLNYWKVFLAVGVIVSVVLVVVVLLLGIAAAGLSGSSENTERYRELEEAALGMAGLIERLETQLNTSISALNELRSNSETLDRRISDIQRELRVQNNEIDNRIDEKLATFKLEQEASVDAKINSEIDQLNLPMLEEAIKQTELNITILNRTLMFSEERLNMLLQNEIANREQLITELRINVNTVQADIKSLNTSTIPAYCSSNVYESTADNASEATSPRISINVLQTANTHVECRGALYSATDWVWLNSANTTLTQPDGGGDNVRECRCRVGPSDIDDTIFVCSMTVTTCTV